MRRSQANEGAAYLGILAAIASIAMLVYQVELSGSALRPISWNLFLLPIVLASFYLGITSGLIVSVVCLGALAPVFLPVFLTYGSSSVTMAQGVTIVLYLIMPILVNNISKQQTREAHLFNVVARNIQLPVNLGEGEWFEYPFQISLNIGAETIGVLALYSNEAEPFGPREREVLKGAAAQIGVAINNANQYVRTDRALASRLTELELLLDASELISSTLDLDEILSALAEKLVSALRMAFCHISLLDESRQRLIVRASAVVSDRPELAPVGHIIELAQAPCCREVIQQGQPRCSRQDDARSALDGAELSLIGGSRTRSVLFVPLAIKGHVLGLITVGEHRAWDRAPITPQKTSLCLAMGAHAAIAIENAQLFNVVKEEGRRTRRILQGIADGVFTTDLDRRILSFNPAAERITGWKANEVIGQFCCDVMRPGDASAVRTCSDDCPLLISVNQGSEAQVGPVVWRASERSSSMLQIACGAAPLSNADGEVIGVVAIFRDVTREAELDQLKSDFVSIVSHEIRAPLASISTAAQVLRSNPESATATELLNLIHSQSMRLSDFVEEVLNVNRLEQGRMELRLEPMPVMPLLRRAVAEAQEITSQHHLKFESHVRAPLVVGDSKAIELIINNLLRNAINYSPGGGLISVEVNESEDEVLICIRDEGIGIPANQIDRIFERFARVDDHDAKTVYGYGLGLYIAKGMVERQGGHIWLESEVGRGSQFTFSLPKFLSQPELEEEHLSLVVLEENNTTEKEKQGQAYKIG